MTNQEFIKFLYERTAQPTASPNRTPGIFSHELFTYSSIEWEKQPSSVIDTLKHLYDKDPGSFNGLGFKRLSQESEAGIAVLKANQNDKTIMLPGNESEWKTVFRKNNNLILSMLSERFKAVPKTFSAINKYSSLVTAHEFAHTVDEGANIENVAPRMQKHIEAVSGKLEELREIQMNNLQKASDDFKQLHKPVQNYIEKYGHALDNDDPLSSMRMVFKDDRLLASKDDKKQFLKRIIHESNVFKKSLIKFDSASYTSMPHEGFADEFAIKTYNEMINAGTVKPRKITPVGSRIASASEASHLAEEALGYAKQTGKTKSFLNSKGLLNIFSKIR